METSVAVRAAYERINERSSAGLHDEEVVMNILERVSELTEDEKYTALDEIRNKIDFSSPQRRVEMVQWAEDLIVNEKIPQ
ncbi:hypothetical protein A2755_03765 [Candidatus Wolfebacteria bacterium RIFCSPHIGHO2_01_FULL_48_22]|uniref:Uncharacterized protein n=2 Tax=Candidatus Wolfeibacteriota TaxID=1752735 RepID=A0A1F8DNU1_9BACT|nr:MAG: hypothetical protein A2755_03765 [Candidatus Wolfebacteria bacterium RIFCSPHIGHO2_01_FULL_48_22]OGM93458.1 MAG: hypothetical protein A2935_01115 [Candidatus Wolfebacteria bacterium RIFCSPLOWO2_01_FULL_47_17b]